MRIIVLITPIATQSSVAMAKPRQNQQAHTMDISDDVESMGLGYAQAPIYRQPLLLLTLLLFSACGVAALSLFKMDERAAISLARQGARLIIASINEGRVRYSQEAVARVRGLDGVHVGADYRNHMFGIPNPATFAIDLGDAVSEREPGVKIRTYSAYPFPQRAITGGPQDEFERSALNKLTDKRSASAELVEEMDGVRSFRYAEPIKMAPSCVACHNTHATSPKKDWKVGDVRGVIMVTQPFDDLRGTAAVSRIAFSSLTVLIVLLTVGLSITVIRLAQYTRRLDEKISERSHRLMAFATTDKLTGLMNRRALETQVNRHWGTFRRWASPVSVLVIDIDDFKAINDELGHMQGDQCLKTVANALLGNLQRPTDIAARYGGDEFVVVLPNTHRDGALTVANGIHQSLAEDTGRVDGAVIRVSIGVSSMVPDETIDLADIIADADQALYRAKREGRDRVVVSDR